MSNVLKTGSYSKQTEQLYKQLTAVYTDYRKDEAAQRLKEIYQNIRDEDKICLSFVGQYSAGKSTIIKALTGDAEILIDSDIATSDVARYAWGSNFLLLDTPGLNTEENQEHDQKTQEAIRVSDHHRNWKVILNTLIDLKYHPKSCKGCPHYKNMILSADAGKIGIRPLVKKKYVTIEEAEESLAHNFMAAVEDLSDGLKLIIAQTGLGKTHTYPSYIKYSPQSFLIVAPTHKLLRELYKKARDMGIENIMYIPELPKLSFDLQSKVMHIYHIGAGQIGLSQLRRIYLDMKPDHVDHPKLKAYFQLLDEAMSFDGHLLITHERFLYLSSGSPLLENRKVIIDEDILLSALPTVTVEVQDIQSALQMNCFDAKEKQRMQDILDAKQFQSFPEKAGSYRTNEEMIELADRLSTIGTNIIDLLNAKHIMRTDSHVTFIKRKYFPVDRAILMSATAVPELYEQMLHQKIQVYRCKEARMQGRILQYINSSYSRQKLSDADLLRFVKELVGDQAVITFKCCEATFHTHYHYGAIEGLNALEGKDIAVVGLPNTDEGVYKLYGMLLGVDPHNKNCVIKRYRTTAMSFI